VLEPNAFTGAVVDRVGVDRADVRWLAQIEQDPDSRALLLGANTVAVEPSDPPRPVLVDLARARALTGGEPLLLGRRAGRPLWALDGGEILPERLVAADTPVRLLALRDAGEMMAPADGGLVAYAAGMAAWHRRHPHCSACGAHTQSVEGGRLRRCPVCGSVHHPRVDPVVIMLVHDGEHLLLGRRGSAPVGRFSILAGFVEPGESLEEAIVREVREEAGVQVGQVTYVSSQPWPFPANLMLGFTARHLSGEPQIGDGELAELGWFTREEVSRSAHGRGPVELPGRVTIARRLIDRWLAEPSAEAE